MKKLSDYALGMTEQEYHESKQLSYSILARYEREGGFSSLPRDYDDLWKPIPETDALTFGAALDTIVTRGEQAYEDEFHMADIARVPQKTRALVEQIVDDGISWTDTDGILKVMDEQKYYPAWRPATRVNKMLEDDGAKYYDALLAARSEAKRIISSEMESMVYAKYAQLEKNKFTNGLLFDKLPEGQERFFQLQFKATVEGIDFKIMCDMIIVDHKEKTIHIYDLKTSGKESSDFRKSYLEWNYHIQSWLYRIVLKHRLMFTDYDDYSVSKFSFIVSSKVNDTPLVFDDESDIEHRRPWLRNPLTIAHEIESAYEGEYPREADDIFDHDEGRKHRKELPDDIVDCESNALFFLED